MTFPMMTEPIKIPLTKSMASRFSFNAFCPFLGLAIEAFLFTGSLPPFPKNARTMLTTNSTRPVHTQGLNGSSVSATASVNPIVSPVRILSTVMREGVLPLLKVCAALKRRPVIKPPFVPMFFSSMMMATIPTIASCISCRLFMNP